jgi:CDP-diacylglycerol--serine O-phosphatidyltransferase
MERVKYIVPNLFTALSLMLGFTSIIITIEGFLRGGTTISFLGSSGPHVILASWVIVWCVLLDKLDGFAAKALNAASAFGAQFDSMADLVAFGVAPGILSYGLAHATSTELFMEHRVILVICIALYVLATAARLARFNAIDMGELADYFHGLPSTIAGAFITLLVILLYKYRGAVSAEGLIIILEISLVACAFLMVSPLLLSKLKPRKNIFINAFQLVNIAGAFICGFGMLVPEYLFSLILLYLSAGFAYGIIKRGEILAKKG